MKFLACADLHIRSTAPAFRKDNYEEAVFNKLNWIVTTANKEEATLLIAGDTFDSHKVSHCIVNKTLDVLQRCIQKPIFCVGNHDQAYHSQDFDKSPLATLHLAGVISMQWSDQIYCKDWEQTECIDESEILLVHETFTEDEPPPFLPNALSAAAAMDKYSGFKYIISGDYHKTHISVNKRDQVLINCGSMMRTNIDQQDHNPCVHLVDTTTGAIETIYIPIKPYEEVFDLRLIDIAQKSHFSEALESLTEALRNTNTDWDWKKIATHAGEIAQLTDEELILLHKILEG